MLGKRLLKIISVVYAVLFLSFVADSQDLSNLKFGGRMQNDWAWMNPDGDVNDKIGNFTDGSEFRRIWLKTTGTLNNNIDFIKSSDDKCSIFVNCIHLWNSYSQ